MTLRRTLQAATRTRHEHLHTVFAPFDLRNPACYIDFLLIQAAALLPMETALEEAGVRALVPDWPDRLRTPSVLADIHALGGHTFPVLEQPLLSGTGAMLGVLYVLEGSRLGGAVLARDVEASDCPRTRAATRFLRHGREQRLFGTYVRLLDSYPLGKDAGQEVIRAAQMAFDFFLQAANLILLRRVGDGSPFSMDNQAEGVS